MRICLISPGHLSTNPRLVKEARALADAQHEVHVICGRYLPWALRHDQALMDPRWRVTQVPFGPIEASKRTYLLQTLRRRSASVLLRLGLGSSGLFEAAHASAGPDLSAAARSVPADLYVAHYIAALPAAARAASAYGGAYG